MKKAGINLSIRRDFELTARAEEILSQLGMRTNSTINMFLRQSVRDKAVPLSLSLSAPETLYADLMKARRRQGDAAGVMQQYIILLRADDKRKWGVIS